MIHRSGGLAYHTGMRRSPILAVLSLFPICSCDCGGDLLDASRKLIVEPEQIDFGEVAVGDLRVKSLHLENRGIADLPITKFELESSTGEFVFATPVPDSLRPSSPLEFNIVYQPSDVGEDRAVLVIVADDGTGEHRVDLVGVGVIGDLSVTNDGTPCMDDPSSIDFGEVVPGEVATHTITVTAIGSDAVKVLSAVLEPGATAEFEIDGPAEPKTLAPGESLEMEVRYRPGDGGRDSGAFIITTDLASSSSIRIPVCGAGVAPAVCAHPLPLDLGLVPEGGSVTATLTVESCGLQPLDLTNLALSTDAGYPTDPGFSIVSLPALPANQLAPGQTVDLAVRFDATALGPASGFVRADSNAYGMPETYFPIQATAARPCDLVVAPSSVTYTGVAIGSTDTRNVLLANNGASTCTITRLETTGAPFSVTTAPALPFTIGTGASELIGVEYAPPDAGPHTGTLTVDAGGLIGTVDLLGNPEEVDDCAVELRPTVLNFGLTSVGSTVHQTISVNAIGSEPCRIRSVRLVLSHPEFTVMAPLVGIVFPMFGADVDVAYAPTAPGAHFDIVEVETSAIGGTTTTVHQVAISGTAANAEICVMPTELHFGTVAAGTVASRTVTISSCGSGTLELRGIMKAPGTPPEFRIAQGPSLPATLPGGASAAPTLTIEYAPTGPGPHFGQFDILSSDLNKPAVPVIMDGNWDQSCDRVLDCTPGTVDFGPTDVGITKIKTIVCRNAGTMPINVSSAGLTAAPASIRLFATTPVTLRPSDIWSLEVRFTPTAAGPATASLAITSDACRNPPAIPVTGSGQPVVLPPCIAPTTFSPTVEWEWHGSPVEPTFNNVWASPVVINLTDDNGDGRVDENDVPEVLFTTFHTVPLSDPTSSQPGVLRVVSGDTGVERFSVTSVRLAESGQLAVGDIDGDGLPEIIGSKWVQTPPGTGAGSFESRYTTGNLVALDRFGNLLWVSDPWSWPAQVLWNASSPYLVDLDGDGFSEIVLGSEVFDHRGKKLWSGTGSHGLTAGAGPQSVAADIDLDGVPEVLAGDTAYRADGSILWRAMFNGHAIGEGGVSVGMLNPSDPYPEIALHNGSALYVLDHTGSVVWNVIPPMGGPSAALPVIADFDGDGDPDVAIADGMATHVYSGTGAPLFNGVVMDDTCCPAISGFDFEGDGIAELVLTDFGNIYAYRGNTGALIYMAPRINPTNLELPVIADIDNDRRAELVVAFYDDFGSSGGIVAYSNVGDSWVAAPRIWNQQAYHVTNVTESGAIPRVETPIPMGPPVFRATVAACE